MEYWYNASFHTSSKTTPFTVLLHGRDPPLFLCYGHRTTYVYNVEEYLAEWDAILKDLKRHFSRAQHQMKTSSDGKR